VPGSFLTRQAGGVLARVAGAALMQLPHPGIEAAQQQGPGAASQGGALSQEAREQLTQMRLNMSQLTQGNSRLQACR
jgi:hypothetical protein